ncbi:amidase [Thermodesulfobacteriota bacterium]
MKLCELTASEASRKIQGGSLSIEEYLRSCLERIQERDEEVKAFTYVNKEDAILQARELDKAPSRGPLHGIPVAVKDMIDTCDMPTGHNSPIFYGHQPSQDAACVRIVRALGGIIIGKTDTHEFAAAGRMPATRNPHNLRCTPGGSSSGSAAAVADFMAPLAFGTQTGGSTIRPAAFCGIYAMKPTYNEVSREGAKVFSVSMDTIGWFSRSVEDLALLAEALGVGREPWKPRESVKDFRIGLCRTPMWEEADPETQQAVEKAANLLENAGAKVEEISLDKPFDKMNDYQDVLMQGEGRAAFRDLYLAYPHLLHDEFKEKVENKKGITTEQFAEAQDIIAASRPRFDQLASPYDAILTPAAPGEAPESLQTTGMAIFNRTWTALHIPCIALPYAQGPRGLPVGVQLVGPRYSDIKLLNTAHAIDGVLSSATHT